MAKNDHLDLLIAELLGDVGKLHDEIRVLKDEALPAIVADAEEKLSTTVGHLIKAAQHFDKAVVKLTQERVEAAKADIAASAAHAKSDAISDVRQAVREAAALPIEHLVGQLNTAVTNANSQQGRTLQHAIIAAVVGGVVAGAIVLGGAYMLFKDSAPATSIQVDDAAPAKTPKKGNKHE